MFKLIKTLLELSSNMKCWFYAFLKKTPLPLSLLCGIFVSFKYSYSLTLDSIEHQEKIMSSYSRFEYEFRYFVLYVYAFKFNLWKFKFQEYLCYLKICL